MFSRVWHSIGNSLATPRNETLSSELSIQEVIAGVQAYVIRIDRGDGCASGILLGHDGLVLTNYHVVRGAESLVATTVDGTRATVEVLTFDRERDLALLRATSTLPEPPLRWTDGDGLGLGEPILVLGYQFPGSQSLDDCSESVTVTRGILSGRLSILGQPMLQTDAPLNPGVSGGLATTDAGDVAGLVVSGLDPNVAESVGFLIPPGEIEARLAEWLPKLAAGTLERPQPRQITFNSDRDGKLYQNIYVMDVDGSNMRRLTDHPGRDRDASWSPDGTQIVFKSDRGGNNDIYVMDRDGSNVRQLTDHPRRDEDPAWSPDGAQIAFSSDRDGDYGIFLMNADGSNLRRLTSLPGVGCISLVVARWQVDRVRE